MPKNFKTGTPHKKTKGCIIPGCDYRGRKSGWRLHIKEVHGIEDIREFYRVQFERQRMGAPSVYDRDANK